MCYRTPSAFRPRVETRPPVQRRDRWASPRCNDTARALVLEHLNVARAAAWRLMRRVEALDHDEVFDVAYFCLTVAAARFGAAQPTSFARYAFYRVRTGLYRALGRGDLRPSGGGFDPDSDCPGDLLVDPSPSPAEVVEVRDMAQEILAESRRLPPRWLPVFELHFVEGKTYGEAAEATGLPLTVASGFGRRAADRIREHLRGGLEV
jgi:DNA-directed RNA polymerase specialized sigma24 family protein